MINKLLEEHSLKPPLMKKAIFSSLFILENRIQTAFDNQVTQVSLKQLMLLVLILKNSNLNYTEYANLLGCSRQNIKKLASSLKEKGYVVIEKGENDKRQSRLKVTEKFYKFKENFNLIANQKLDTLFSIYTEEELKTLFHLISKLYIGCERLEKGE